MTRIQEGDLTFSFPDCCQASKYDDWAFYRNQFEKVAGGSKAVDILCLDGDISWLIEIKDYREHPRTQPLDIADEFALKVRDTLAGLAAAAKQSNNDADHRELAREALAKRRWRVVLHLEQPTTVSRLRPQAINTNTILQKLKSRKKLKAIDAHPVICDRNNIPPCIPWTIH